MCSPSSPSILCSLSDDSVNSKSIPFIPNCLEDRNDRCSKRICMDDVMSKLLDTAPSTSNLITSANENKVQSDTISTDEYITNCLSGEIDAKNQSENDFEKTDNMASLNKADDKHDVTYRNRIFHLRRSFSESALMLVKDGDVLMKEATDEQIQENLRSLRFDLDKLFNESEVIITKYVEHFWNFIEKTEEESTANNSQSPIPMSERLACIEDFTNTLRKEFKEYNNMIKRIVGEYKSFSLAFY
ncbi:unnamed protein product [Acanthosepion pharaonis]|uniref:Uncharacterized protein n=1 Tax=Acanthosepion pharaonis TaxID=158019 RepID=A0A812EHI7_ACAPH|nr:unnamed protein product [Sepia pharaonis]